MTFSVIILFKTSQTTQKFLSTRAETCSFCSVLISILYLKGGNKNCNFVLDALQKNLEQTETEIEVLAYYLS